MITDVMLCVRHAYGIVHQFQIKVKWTKGKPDWQPLEMFQRDDDDLIDLFEANDNYVYPRNPNRSSCSSR
jgi:hypothetical protein